MTVRARRALFPAFLGLVAAVGSFAAEPRIAVESDLVAQAPEESSTATEITEESAPVRNLGGILDEIRVPDRTAREFTQLYLNHRQELLRILSDRPALIWQTLELVLEALPALKAVEEREGRIYLDKKLYRKVDSFLGTFEQYCSLELASDLRKIQRFVLDRMEEIPNDQVVIDLN
ncbi:MAG TPA: hypothetical protein PLM79_12195 [Syntrophobacteraceae bacterium]|nr:hypothetical protein [Syntrophobacteraceae bacterium]